MKIIFWKNWSTGVLFEQINAAMCFFQNIIYRTCNLFIIFPFDFGVNGDLEMFSQSWSINNKAWHFQPFLFLLHNFSTIYYSRFILYLSIKPVYLSLAHHLFFSISFSSICNHTAPSLFLFIISLSPLLPPFIPPSRCCHSLWKRQTHGRGEGGGDERRELLGDGCWETDVGGVAVSQSQEWRCLGDRGFTLSYRIWRKMGGITVPLRGL